MITSIWWATYPPAFQISDEKAYIEQAIYLSKGQVYNEFQLKNEFISYNPKNYPIGTSLLAVPFVYFLGNWSIFLLAPSCLILTFSLTRMLLRSLCYPSFSAYLIFLFLPSLIISRHVMSEIPSALLVALFLFVINQQEKSIGYLYPFLLGLLTFMSLLFREANLLLLLPFFIAWTFKRHKKEIFFAFLGCLLGLFFRGISSFIFYDNIWYFKDTGVKFLIASIVPNMPIYLMGTVILIPGGLWMLFKYKGWYRESVFIAIGGYILLHLLYRYNGEGADSGSLGGKVLVLRFIIPTLPIFALVAGEWMKLNPKILKFKRLVIALITTIFITVSIVDFQKGLDQRGKLEILYSKGINPCKTIELYEYCSTLYN